jgi:hypothetical protein
MARALGSSNFAFDVLSIEGENLTGLPLLNASVRARNSLCKRIRQASLGPDMMDQETESTP